MSWEGVGSLDSELPFVVVRSSGRLAMFNCSVSSASPGALMVRLIDVLSEAQVRGCVGRNVTIDATTLHPTVAVVNSTFEPPLNPHVPGADSINFCRAVVAGSIVCDPRARCEAGLGGGVKCECVGAYIGGSSLSTLPDSVLRYAPDNIEDGRQCEQDPRLVASVQSEAVSLSLRKPGTAGKWFKLKVEALGERALTVTCNTTMERLDRFGQIINTQHGLSIGQPSLSWFGQHLEWQGGEEWRALPEWSAMLDGASFKYSDLKESLFTLRLQCENGSECVADGEQIRMTIQVDSPIGIHTSTTVLTTVESLVSCSRSLVLMSNDSSLFTDTDLLEIHLYAVDVDGLGICVSVPSAVLLWGAGDSAVERIVPSKPQKDSNHFVLSVPLDLRSVPGTYFLRLVLNGAWNETRNGTDQCILVDRVISIERKPGVNTVWISVGSLAACALFVVAGIVWAMRRSAELRHILVMVLTEITRLAGGVVLELGDLSLDLLATYRVVFVNGVATPAYVVPYAVLGCFSIVVGLVSLAHHASHMRKLCTELRHQERMHVVPVTDLAAESDEFDTVHIERKLRWELEKCSRDLKALGVSMLVLMVEQLPMVRSLHSLPFGLLSVSVRSKAICMRVNRWC
jgi:hypothetical protein